jgi:NitT/TauT family transport system substrate-binding protein
MRKASYLLFLVIISVLVSACTGGNPPQQKIQLPMGYVANVQFSPFYVAKERGYFQDAGFDVAFDYRWETDGIQLVAANELPFTLASGDQVIQARSQGLPVVAVASWYQRFPVAVISLAETPLESPADLAGLSVGTPETFGASYIGLQVLLEAGGLTEADIDLQVIGYTQVAALTSGQVDAVVVYANNAPAILETQDIDFNALYVANYAELVSNVLVSNEARIEEDPEMVRMFVGAFLHGLEDVLDDPDAAFEISKTYVESLEENAETQRAVLALSVDYWRAPQLGYFEATAWEQAVETMQASGLIDDVIPVEPLYTNQFVK